MLSAIYLSFIKNCFLFFFFSSFRARLIKFQIASTPKIPHFTLTRRPFYCNFLSLSMMCACVCVCHQLEHIGFYFGCCYCNWVRFYQWIWSQFKSYRTIVLWLYVVSVCVCVCVSVLKGLLLLRLNAFGLKHCKRKTY